MAILVDRASLHWVEEEMFVREYGLVHNAGDSERYVRLVKWEVAWHDVGGGMEMKRALPLAVERTLLDASNPRAYDYDGPQYALVITAVTELSLRRWPTMAPKEALPESEELRRERIRVLRRACHVDPAKGAAEPVWVAEHVFRPKAPAPADYSAAA